MKFADGRPADDFSFRYRPDVRVATRFWKASASPSATLDTGPPSAPVFMTSRHHDIAVGVQLRNSMMAVVFARVATGIEPSRFVPPDQRRLRHIFAIDKHRRCRSRGFVFARRAIVNSTVAALPAPDRREGRAAVSATRREESSARHTGADSSKINDSSALFSEICSSSASLAKI